MNKIKRPYYIKYLVATGLGQKKEREWFVSKSDQIRRTKEIQAAGCQLKGFGRVGV